MKEHDVGRSSIDSDAGFSASWLQQREPFDTAARDLTAPRLGLPAWLATQRGSPTTPWRVIDLGCGTGANLRWLAPHLGGPQQWLAVDHDAALLARWPAAMGVKAADPLEAPLRWRRPGFEASIVRRQLDLERDLESLPWASARLVTASALLDLVGTAWLHRLVTACRSAKAALLFALTVDGRHHWTPADPADALVAAAFAAHQGRDKGFGPALGPRAATELLQMLRSVGYRVRDVPSDWWLDGRTDPAARALQLALIDGMASAASAQEPGARAAVAAWQRRRRGLVALSSLRVGHLDVIATPPR